jgi:hypothetical protein
MYINNCFIGLLVALCITSCNAPKKQKKDEVNTKYTEPAEALSQGLKLLQDGDLVLRTEEDVVSASIRNFAKTDKTYSHCGIAYFEDSSWYVYHLIAGDENPTGIIKKEKFAKFIDANHKSRYGIFRYLLDSTEQIKMKDQILTYYAQNVKFDTGFDLNTDSVLYCAEMVYKALKLATNNRVILPSTIRNNFSAEKLNKQKRVIKRFEYIAIDNLYLNPNCKEIKRFRYEFATLERE